MIVASPRPDGPPYNRMVHPRGSDPAILWRLTRGTSAAHATIFPGDAQTTVTWFFDGVMDRAENYQTLDLAMARADHIKTVLLKDGWKEA